MVSSELLQDHFEIQSGKFTDMRYATKQFGETAIFQWGTEQKLRVQSDTESVQSCGSRTMLLKNEAFIAKSAHIHPRTDLPKFGLPTYGDTPLPLAHLVVRSRGDRRSGTADLNPRLLKFRPRGAFRMLAKWPDRDWRKRMESLCTFCPPMLIYNQSCLPEKACSGFIAHKIES